MHKEEIKKLAFCALFGALGFVLMLLEFPLPIIPSFVKFDFSELPALVVSFVYGPLYGVLVCFLKNVLHLFVTTSAGVGEVSNFILGAIFVAVAGLIYKYNKSRKYALLGSLAGALAMAIISIFSNYFIVYPAFSVLYHLPMPAIIGMYQAILPSVDGLFEALIIFNLPFNFAKGIIDAAICFLVYKKLSPILKK
ncbi:MAG: ECF transporter S component [Clostridia bacterium]|nr:ECF transporter S component [Clostridia bacterium]MBQ3058425.1 ECF transporter S component [Clostridia bacterium]